VSKARIVGIILGVIGLLIISFALIETSVALGMDIRNYELWEISLFSQAAVGLTSSLTLGIVGLLVNKERKSPYLLGVSTVLTFISMFPVYLRNVIKGYSSLEFILSISIPSILLLVSTILIAYVNIWKKTEKAIK